MDEQVIQITATLSVRTWRETPPVDRPGRYYLTIDDDQALYDDCTSLSLPLDEARQLRDAMTTLLDRLDNGEETSQP